MFVGFSAEQRPSATMLESMAGLTTASATRYALHAARSPAPTTSYRRRRILRVDGVDGADED